MRARSDPSVRKLKAGPRFGRRVYVHVKAAVADDDVVHLGSANLSNRSMGFDSECGITVEALDRQDVREAVVGYRGAVLAAAERRSAQTVATLEGFEPSISTLKGWRAGPLHHRVVRWPEAAV